METYTEKEPLILREYGRNVQKLVQYITTLPTVEERTQASHTLINLMKQLNPSVREHNDNMQRIWDHLHHMANFDLDINSPFPKPTPETIFAKPQKLGYTLSQPKFRHYGRNIELLIAKAIPVEDAEERLNAIQQIMRLMRGFYAAANNDTVEDELLLEHINILSNGKLRVNPDEVLDSTIAQPNKMNNQRQQNNRTQGQGGNNNNSRSQGNGMNNRNRNQTQVQNNEQRRNNNSNRENTGEKRNTYSKDNKNFKKK